MDERRAYLTRGQIEAIVERVGQPEATTLLGWFFESYRRTLTSDDVADLYDEEYFERIANHPVAELVAGRYPIHIYGIHAFRYLRDRALDGDVLDFGCGHGEMTLALAALGARRVVGVDSDTGLLEQARERVPEGRDVTFQTPTELAETDATFDYAVLSDVTEHLGDGELAALFSLLATRLRAGGELVIHTPNGLALGLGTDRDVGSRLLLLIRRLLRRPAWVRDAAQLYYEQVHINVKSARQLAGALRPHGFVTNVRYDERPFLARYRSENMLVVARRN